MKKILLIEDDHILQKMYQNKFQNMGYAVLLASDGGEGYKLAKEEKPDLILLDLIMPRISGVAALKMLKDNPDTKDIPVAILSVIPEDDPLLESHDKLLKNVVAYLRKDETNPSNIVDKVSSFLKDNPNG